MLSNIPKKNLEAGRPKSITGPLSSTGKACYCQVQHLEGYHKILFLLLCKRGVCLLWNGSVIVRLRPSTFLHDLSSSWMLRKSWEKVDGILPLCKTPRWWGCTEKKKMKKRKCETRRNWQTTSEIKSGLGVFRSTPALHSRLPYNSLWFAIYIYL